MNSLQFDNRNQRQLPIDLEERNFPRQVSDAIFSKVTPQQVKNPRLMSFSPAALALLGFPPEHVYSTAEKQQLAQYFSGNTLFPGSVPIAHVYCGHQFGSFSGQLGDGAAISLGEVINPTSTERWELQLKGAGKTPFSRTADGRKVLRSSVREYLCSEAMHALNIPSTRAATLIVTDTRVARDPHYDDHVVMERCAVVSRLAPHFFRFGSFEIFKPAAGPPGSRHGRAGPSTGNDVLKQQLLDHMLLYFPEIQGTSAERSRDTITTATNSNSNNNNNNELRYLRLFEEVTRLTAVMAARWQAVGFVHGVLNTDNMSLAGLTIDYGPFGFMEYFDFDFTPNGSDSSGRYSFKNQREMCKWNLVKLSEALHPLLPMGSSEQAVQVVYDAAFDDEYENLMRQKLGLTEEMAGDDVLIADLLHTMQTCASDYTDTFSALTQLVTFIHTNIDTITATITNTDTDTNSNTNTSRSSSSDVVCSSELVNEEQLAQVIDFLVSRSASPGTIVDMCMRKFRIHKLEMHVEQIKQIDHLLTHNPTKALEMFGADLEDVRETVNTEKMKLFSLSTCSEEMKTMQQTSSETKSAADAIVWRAWIDRYLARLQLQHQHQQAEALLTMRAVNPVIVLRGWVAQLVIEAAERDEDELLATALHMLTQPSHTSYRDYQWHSFLNRRERARVGVNESVCTGGGPIVVTSADVCGADVGDGVSIGAADGDVQCTREQQQQVGAVSSFGLSQQEMQLLAAPPTWAGGLVCTCSS